MVGPPKRSIVALFSIKSIAGLLFQTFPRLFPVLLFEKSSEPVVLRVSELPLVAILNVKTNASANQSKRNEPLEQYRRGHSGGAPNELFFVTQKISKRKKKNRDFDEEDFDERKRRRNFKAKRGIEKCYPRVFTSLFFTNALTSSTNFSCSTHGFPISRPRAHTYPFNEFISKGAPASKSNLVDGKCAP